MMRFGEWIKEFYKALSTTSSEKTSEPKSAISKNGFDYKVKVISGHQGKVKGEAIANTVEEAEFYLRFARKHLINTRLTVLVLVENLDHEKCPGGDNNYRPIMR
jgi:hypothetical protein